MQASALSVHDLACRRGDRVLFAGLGLDLKAGDAVQIVGRNGIGKSSLLRIMAGLLRPFAGTVTRHGAVGLMNEHCALDMAQDLGTALDFWARLDGSAIAEERTGLGDLGDVPVRYLSTGQRKRATLARLIGQGASIWLLDEPLNGLDTAGVALVEALVAEHCYAGGICVIASHQSIAVPGLMRRDLADFVL